MEFRLNLSTLIVSMSLLTYGAFIQAQHEEEPHEIDEIIVTSALNRTKADTALPVHVLSDEALREQAANTLGDTLQNLPGVHATSFGVGVGQPVIRGLSGNRVSILQDNLAVADASGVSQDHASALEPLLAERIEVLRGPATLLYGNGAIGGVVNVIDNRIPTTLSESTTGALEVRSNSVNHGKTVVGKLDGNVSQLAWHIDGVYREADNTDIPGFAIDEDALTEPVDENSRGEIENSEYDADQFTMGGAWHFDKGFVGLAFSELNNNYGIPPGAHEDHDHDPSMPEPEEEVIRIDMKQRRIDLKGEFELTGVFDRLKFQLANNEYQHSEVEGGAVGTRFINEGLEGRLSLEHRNDTIAGTIGTQWLQRDFRAVGFEAFIPPVDIESWGLFTIQQWDVEPMVLEFGLRWDKQQISPNACGTDENSFSASASALWHWTNEFNVYATLNRSQRAATVEEAFSNIDLTTCLPQSDENLLVEHAATARVEIGDANLDKESANSLEIGLTRYRGDITWELNGFYNQFSDFIYLTDVGLLSDGVTIVSRYLQDNTTLYGLESKATWLVETQNDAHLDVSVFADWVRAKLGNDDFLPRIPPWRLGLELAYVREHWSAKLHSTAVAKQNNTAVNEMSTDGYMRWDFYSDYHWNINDCELLLFAKLSNITDEEIRDHTSFLKNFAPAAGSDITLGLRYIF